MRKQQILEIQYPLRFLHSQHAFYLSKFEVPNKFNLLPMAWNHLNICDNIILSHFNSLSFRKIMCTSTPPPKKNSYRSYRSVIILIGVCIHASFFSFAEVFFSYAFSVWFFFSRPGFDALWRLIFKNNLDLMVYNDAIPSTSISKKHFFFTIDYPVLLLTVHMFITNGLWLVFHALLW